MREHLVVGIWIELRGEKGEAVRGMPDPAGGTFDAAGDIDRVLAEGVAGSRLLRYVDPYGDTILNGLQMADLLLDIDDIRSSYGHRLKPIERRGLDRLATMAETCRDGVHLYLWFIGD